MFSHTYTLQDERCDVVCNKLSATERRHSTTFIYVFWAQHLSHDNYTKSIKPAKWNVHFVNSLDEMTSCWKPVVDGLRKSVAHEVAHVTKDTQARKHATPSYGIEAKEYSRQESACFGASSTAFLLCLPAITLCTRWTMCIWIVCGWASQVANALIIGSELSINYHLYVMLSVPFVSISGFCCFVYRFIVRSYRLVRSM